MYQWKQVKAKWRVNDEWGKVFEDNTVVSAIIDRLVHHASIFYIASSSYRLKNKLKKAN